MILIDKVLTISCQSYQAKYGTLQRDIPNFYVHHIVTCIYKGTDKILFIFFIFLNKHFRLNVNYEVIVISHFFIPL